VAYRVELRPAALRDLKSLPREVLDRVSEKIDSLPENPRPPGVEKLSGSEDSYRVRVGDYRILYRIVDEALLVLVVAVRHRKEAYRRV
jgi:mRNA interferase RelE/StbE